MITGSTDGTLEFIETVATGEDFHRVHCERHEFHDFGSARQACLDLVKTDWAFWLDADEMISPALHERLTGLRRTGRLKEYDGYRIHRSNRVLGRVMRSRRLAHDFVLRLFRTDRGQLSKSLVHESIDMVPDSRVGHLNEAILHDSLNAIGPFLKKVDMYTTLDVANPKDKRFNPFHLLVTGPLTFVKDYFLRGAIRDGWSGFVWSAIAAHTCVQRDLKRLRRDWHRWRTKNSTAD